MIAVAIERRHNKTRCAKYSIGNSKMRRLFDEMPWAVPVILIVFAFFMLLQNTSASGVTDSLLFRFQDLIAGILTFSGVMLALFYEKWKDDKAKQLAISDYKQYFLPIQKEIEKININTDSLEKIINDNIENKIYELIDQNPDLIEKFRSICNETARIPRNSHIRAVDVRFHATDISSQFYDMITIIDGERPENAKMSYLKGNINRVRTENQQSYNIIMDRKNRSYNFGQIP